MKKIYTTFWGGRNQAVLVTGTSLSCVALRQQLTVFPNCLQSQTWDGIQRQNTRVGAQGGQQEDKPQKRGELGSIWPSWGPSTPTGRAQSLQTAWEQYSPCRSQQPAPFYGSQTRAKNKKKEMGSFLYSLTFMKDTFLGKREQNHQRAWAQVRQKTTPNNILQ